MKNLLCLLIFALVLVSCNKNPEEDDDITILGIWEMTSVTSNKPIDFNDDGINENMATTYKITFHFLESGTFYYFFEFPSPKNSEILTDKYTGTWEIGYMKDILYLKITKYGGLQPFFEKMQKISLSKNKLIMKDLEYQPDHYLTITYKRI